MNRWPYAGNRDRQAALNPTCNLVGRSLSSRPEPGGSGGFSMFARLLRPRPLGGLVLLALAAAVGCAGAGRHHHFGHSRDDARSVDELHRSAGWYDLDAQLEIR